MDKGKIQVGTTDIYSDNKPTKQNVDQSIKISWSDNHSELIDVSAEDVSAPTINKD